MAGALPLRDRLLALARLLGLALVLLSLLLLAIAIPERYRDLSTIYAGAAACCCVAWELVHSLSGDMTS